MSRNGFFMYIIWCFYIFCFSRAIVKRVALHIRECWLKVCNVYLRNALCTVWHSLSLCGLRAADKRNAENLKFVSFLLRGKLCMLLIPQKTEKRKKLFSFPSFLIPRKLVKRSTFLVTRGLWNHEFNGKFNFNCKWITTLGQFYRGRPVWRVRP